MKKLLIVLLLMTIHSMGESFQNRKDTLTQEERFEMLFGKTEMVYLGTTVKSRSLRVSRNTRVPELHMAGTVEENQESLFGNRMTYHRTARSPRKGCSRQKRHGLYLTLNY